LLDKLAQDLESNNLQPKGKSLLKHRARVVSLTSWSERDAALEELKIYGRDPRNSDPIFTRRVRLSVVLSAP
jgi:hypothetical protein